VAIGKTSSLKWFCEKCENVCEKFKEVFDNMQGLQVNNTKLKEELDELKKQMEQLKVGREPSGKKEIKEVNKRIDTVRNEGQEKIKEVNDKIDQMRKEIVSKKEINYLSRGDSEGWSGEDRC